MKKLKSSVYLIITFIAVAYFSLSIISNIEESTIIQSEHNNFISKDSVYFQIDGENKNINKLISNIKLDYILLKNSTFENKFGIMFKGTLKNSPKLLSGRFFKEDDFNCGKKYIVLGKELKSNIETRSGKDYYYINNEYYEVIGIMGDNKKPTSNDYDLFFNLDSLFFNNSIVLSGNYYLDVNDKSKEIYYYIQGLSKENNCNLVLKDIERDKKLLSEIITNKSFTIGYITKILLIFIINILLIMNYWIEKKKKEIGLKRAMGGTKRKVFWELVKEILIMSLSSFIIGDMLYILISYIKTGYIHMYIYSIFIVFGITLMLALLISLVVIKKINKMELAEIMR